ncbi:phospholipid-transporting ATPase ABCA3-like [Ornithodoros turicata]|uniref:phospholipid-transporting ATPase ABCA3-like n=1 Tax=Ornithodoros turicata TaxID=34597 RepID=UPI003139A1DF
MQLKHGMLSTSVEMVVPGLLSYLYFYLEAEDPTDAAEAESGRNTSRRLHLPHAVVRYLSAHPTRFLAAEPSEKIGRIMPGSNITRVVVVSEREAPNVFMIAMLPLVVVLLLPFPLFVYRVGDELYTGLKNFLIVNGMSNTAYWTGTFVVEFIKVFLVMVPILYLWNNNPHGGPAIFKKTSLEVQISLVSLFCSASVGNALLVAAVTPRPIVSAASIVVLSLSTLVLPLVAVAGTNMQYTHLMRYLQLLSCLFPHVAFCYALASMFVNDRYADHDIDWRNIHEVGLQDVTLHKAMHAMLASFLGSVLLCVYIDKVWPYENDFPESAWFFLERSYWGADKVAHNPLKAKTLEQNALLVEPVSEEMKPYIVLYKLSKTVNTGQKQEILHCINLKLYADHITVLLGRNGTGKTLILKIITGATRPNRGTVFLNTLNIVNDGQEIRKLLGVCPQNVALYGSMTIKENLQFFAGVKEMHSVRPADEVNLALLEYQLYGMRNTRVRELKYGQKRRVQLAIALLGMPEYIILDEPTRGVSRESRRAVWEAILKIRQTRGILLLTSSIDEAHALADRIAIVTSGVIAACGSPIFLQKQHGSGYRMSVVFAEGSEKSRATNFVANILPTIAVLIERPRLVVYSIGYPRPAKLIKMLKQLETNQELGIIKIGVASTTLEDILLKFDATPAEFDFYDYKEEPTRVANNKLARRVHVAKDVPLLFYQVDALTRKKLIYLVRSLKPIIITKLIQFAFMFFMEGYFENSDLWSRLERLNLANVSRSTRSGTSRNTTMYYDYDWVTREMHSVVFSARALATFVVPLSLSIMTSYYVFLPIEERGTGAKQIQLMTGVTPERYWTVNFCTDVIQHLLGSFAAAMPLAIPTSSTLNCHDSSYFGPMFCLFFMYGWAFIPVCYLASLVMDEGLTAYFGLVLSSLLFGAATNSYMALVGPSTVSHFRPPDFASEITEFLMVPLRLLPQFALGHGVGQVQMFFFERAACCHLPTDLLQYTCEHSVDDYPDEQRQYMTLAKVCCKANCEESRCTFVTSDMTFSNKSSFWDIALMFLSGVLYLTLVISWERRPDSRNCLLQPLRLPEVVRLRKQLPIRANISHPTVLAEASHVRTLVDQLTDPGVLDKPRGLVLDDISFTEGTTEFPHMSLYVAPKEIFGVVGLAQSGRSTLFRAVAGLKSLQSGELYLNTINLNEQRTAYQKHIGYCPQKDPLIRKLTVREMLMLLARLRGLNPQEVEEEVSFIVGKVGLLRVEHRNIGQLPHGQRRQLSVGLALIGDRDFVILDDPTEGVDPISRMKLMQSMEKVHATHNFSVLITSRRMAECETLCDRVSFLSDGEFAALGTPLELKGYIGQRFIVTIRLTAKLATKGDFFKWVNRQIKAVFPSSVITDVRKDQLTYRVKDVVIAWSEVFKKMEQLRATVKFEDYAVNEDSLADVFLGFAHERKVVDFGGVDAIHYYSANDPPILLKKAADTEVPKLTLSEAVI